MEKIIFGEELRALFREIFKIEVKDVTSDVAFLGKMRGTKLNQERLTLKERKWLENLGVLTTDSKNQIDVDDRTIFSHIISAVYAGLYGLNFVDVTSHCLETIKQRKGLKENQNLVDYLSAKELRQFSTALYSLSNEIRQQKKAGNLTMATMDNFYYVANRAFVSGLNARRNYIFDQNSEFVVRETSNLNATNTLKNIDASLALQTFSHKLMQPKNVDQKLCQEQKNNYIASEQQIRFILQKMGLDASESNKVLASIDEGYYKSKYFRQHNLSISNIIHDESSMLTEVDMDCQNTKLLYAKVALNSLYKRSKISNIQFRDILNHAFRSGTNAREDCIMKHNTSPEYFASFSSALLFDKEKKMNIKN